MLSANNVSKSFKQGKSRVSAVRNVEINIGPGERVYIHGPSGAGKSTLLQMLGGLSTPTEGEITFHGKNIYKFSDRKRSRLRNRNFGFVFQFYHLLPELNALENVMLPAFIKGRESGKAVRRRAENILEKVGMTGRLKHRPSQLSGGEVQRTAIARALINAPEVLFCDEPTGNLDSAMSAQIYALLKDISVSDAVSVVVVSHQDVGENFSTCEYFMKDGILSGVSPENSSRRVRSSAVI